MRLSTQVKEQYSELVPVLSGCGKGVTLTLFGRRRDDPARLDKLISEPWAEGEKVTIEWVVGEQMALQKN